MIKNNYIFILLSVLILSVPHKVQAQVNSDWQRIGLTVAGYNIVDGVEALFQVNSCNGKDVIYVRYINHTNSAVKIDWNDAVFTEDQKWINKDADADKKSITIPANSEVKGECPASSNGESVKPVNKNPQLIIDMKDFITDKKNFKLYSAANFRVTAGK